MPEEAGTEWDVELMLTVSASHGANVDPDAVHDALVDELDDVLSVDGETETADGDTVVFTVKVDRTVSFAESS